MTRKLHKTYKSGFIKVTLLEIYLGIKDANQRACDRKNSEIVGFHPSTDPLKLKNLLKKFTKQLNHKTI